MILVNLTEEARIELERFRSHSDKKGSERALYVLMNASGNSIPEIAKLTHRHVLTIRNGIKLYVEFGLTGLYRKLAPGRPSQRNEKFKPFLIEIIDKSPEDYGYFEKIWTIKMMIDCYQKRSGITLSHDTVQRSLKELGFSFKRSRLSVSPNAPSKEDKLECVRQIIYEIRQAIDDGDVEVFFVDEAHISTQPFISRGWSKKKSPSIYANPTQERRKNHIWRVELTDDKILLQGRTKI